MKYTIEKIAQGEDELILRYQSNSPEVENIIQFMNGRQNKLLGKTGQETVLICPDDLLYIESVDGKTFAYTETEIFRIDKTLQALGQILYDEKYFRCSKSMIVNVAQILHMTEMILLAYGVGYLQVYVFGNFDETDSFGVKEILGAFCCVIIYTVASYMFGWFDKSIPVTIGFAAYVVVLYVSVWLVYKVRRTLDNKLLNDDLALFQTRHNK